MARGKASPDGSTRTAPNGYHYTKVDGRWELTHRLTIERHLGRKLKPTERTKFKDGNPANYRDPNNIVVYETKSQSNGKELARLRAKRDEIDARILELESQEA